MNIHHHYSTKKEDMAQQNIEKYGIEESKPTVEIITTAITSVANLDTNQDGDIQALEVLNALQTVAFKVIRRVPNLAQLRLEVTDYSEAEKQELRQLIIAQVDMPSAKVEYLVERALNILIDLVDFAMEVQKPAEEFESA